MRKFSVATLFSSLTCPATHTFFPTEIIFNPFLILSPHVFLPGLIFADRAFDCVEGEEVLVSASQIPRLGIHDGCNKLPLLIDPALDDVPIFRMSERNLQGISISPDKPLPYTTIEPWVKKIGVITGFPQVTRPYSLRYGAGTALDSSGRLLQHIGLRPTPTSLIKISSPRSERPLPTYQTLGL